MSLYICLGPVLDFKLIILVKLLSSGVFTSDLGIPPIPDSRRVITMASGVTLDIDSFHHLCVLGNRIQSTKTRTPITILRRLDLFGASRIIAILTIDTQSK